MESRRARRSGEPAGPHRGRRDRRARFALPRHAGHRDHRVLRRRGGLDRRQREDARAPRRHRLREDLPVPELARRLLPRRQADRDEGHLPQVRRTPARCAGARRGSGRQAHQRAGDGAPDGRDDLRPRGSRALLRAASSAARRIRSTSRAWSPRTCCAATCRSATGTPPEAASCSTCASRRNSPWRACPTRSTSRSASCGRVSTSCLATARSSSSAAPGQRAYYATRMLMQKGLQGQDPRRRHAVADPCATNFWQSSRNASGMTARRRAGRRTPQRDPGADRVSASRVANTGIGAR